MRWFITGGAGFIGSHFVAHILDTYPQDEVICYDALTYAGNLAYIEKYIPDPRFVFVKGDICDQKALDDVLSCASVDAVVNFAAESHVDRSIENAQAFLQTNVAGVGMLLDAVNAYGIPRFHQVSTDEVYGDVAIDEKELRSESHDLRPSSPYAASKAAADLLTLSYARTHRTPVTISRSSNNYGTHQHTEKLIPKVISMAKNHLPVPIYGDGENIRDWLHVKDHCRAIDFIVRFGSVGEIYHVAGGHELSNNALVAKILSIIKDTQNIHAQTIHVPDRAGHDLRYAISCEKIFKTLGFRPVTPFDEGLADTVAWYLANLP